MTQRLTKTTATTPADAIVVAAVGPRVAFVAEAAKRGIPEQRIDFFEVPGAFEIPLEAQLLARTGGYAAIVAAGFVVDGGIYRHEFVADAVISGLMRVQLETEVPVISAVLTPQRFHEHEEHRNFFRSHFVVKGAEAAAACATTIANMQVLARLGRRGAKATPARFAKPPAMPPKAARTAGSIAAQR